MAENKKKKIDWWLWLILAVGLVLRLVRFNQIPPGLFGDEVDTGYQAYSLVKTGRDYFSNLLPIHFQSYGDWRMPLYIYLLAPLVGLFGLSETITRLPSVFFSLGFIWATAQVGYLLTKKKSVLWLTALFLVLSGWQFHFSRLALEVTLFGFLFMVGVYFWLKEERKISLAAICWGLSVYAYSTAKLFVPLWLVGLFLIYRKQIKLKNWLVLAGIFGLIILPIGLDSLFGQGGARFGSISIFNLPIEESVTQTRMVCDLDHSGERVFHNKGWARLEIFFDQYLSSFSLEYLALRGDPSPRHNPLNLGQLNPLLCPLLLIGGYALVRSYRRTKKPALLLLPLGLILTPIPAALTQGGGTQAIRTYLSLVWFVLLAAWGGVELVGLVKKRWRLIVVCGLAVFYLLFTYRFFHLYFHHFNQIEWRRWWNEGYREVFAQIELLPDGYDEVWISPSWEPPVVYTMFYSQFDPRQAQSELVVSPEGLGRFVFKSFDLNQERLGPERLMVVPPGELEAKGLAIENDNRFKVLGKVHNQSGELVFYLFELVSLE